MALRTLNTNHLFFCWAWLAMLAGNNLTFSFLLTRRLYVWYPWWHNVGLSLGCSCRTSHLLFTVSSAGAAGKEGGTRAFSPSLCWVSLEHLCSLTCSQSPFKFFTFVFGRIWCQERNLTDPWSPLFHMVWLALYQIRFLFHWTYHKVIDGDKFLLHSWLLPIFPCLNAAV